MYEKLTCCSNSASCAECPRYPVATKLNSCPLFKQVPQSDFVEIMQTTHHQVRHFSKGSMVAQANESCAALYVVLEGTVVGEMIDASGRSIVIDEISAPNTIASAFIFGVNNRFPVNITAKTDVEILLFAKNDLLSLLQSNTTILQNYLFILSNQSQFLAQKIHFLNFKTLRGKIASYLIKNEINGNGIIRIPHTQQELADFFGVARQSLNRSLGELHDEGIIQHERNKIQILNRQRLIQQME